MALAADRLTPPVEGDKPTAWFTTRSAPATIGASGQEGPSAARADERVFAARTGIYGAILMLIGILLSGPVGILIVTAVHPQPAWPSARAVADNYHAIQTLPFFFGFVLIIGCDLLIAALYRLADEKDKTRALLAVICAAAFTGLISFNYLCQTTFVPALLTSYRPENDAVVAALSLVNPRSLSWAIEMWGWGLLGLATWLIAPTFHGSRLERATAGMCILNGIVSIVGAAITAADLGWVMTVPGYVNFVAWNVLMVVLAVLAILSLSRRSSFRAPVATAPRRRPLRAIGLRGRVR
jgi:hypothetical protein